jgi:hypothetical protein
MNSYYFTKQQASLVARNMVVGYHENVANQDQDAERLACRLTGALEIFVLPSDVENAFNWLDELAALERGTHEDLDVNAAGTIDNGPDLAEYLEGQLIVAIDDIVSGFRNHWALAA